MLVSEICFSVCLSVSGNCLLVSGGRISLRTVYQESVCLFLRYAACFSVVYEVFVYLSVCDSHAAVLLGLPTFCLFLSLLEQPTEPYHAGKCKIHCILAESQPVFLNGSATQVILIAPEWPTPEFESDPASCC